MNRRYVIAACAVGAAAILAWGARSPRRAEPDEATSDAASASADAAASASATSGVAEAPPPRSKPKEPCEVIVARIIGLLGTDDAALANEDRDALFQDARELGRGDDGGVVDLECRAKAFAALRERKTCGRAEAAVAGGLAVARIVDPADFKTLVERASKACASVFAESASFAANVDLSLARALLARARRDPDEVVRRSAWLAYGSMAEIASRTGRNDVRSEVETTVAAELARSRGKARVLAVQAAGNAGCRPCLPTLLTLSDSPDAELRRNAVAAMRFNEDERAIRRACAALENDAEASVRDLTAWSLGLRTTSPVIRVPCLYRAALGDASERVRGAATQSLGGLSDDLEPAYAALVQLSGPEAPKGVRELATRILATDPQHATRELDEAAIAKFLEAAHEDMLLEDGSAPSPRK